MSQRIDLYGPIHKAIRRMLFETTVRLGSTDFRSSEQTESVLDQLQTVIRLAAEHAEIEDAIFHPPLEERSPGACTEQIDDHESLEATQEAMFVLAEELKRNDAAGRNSLGKRLYQTFTDYTSHQLDHMAGEERHLAVALWDNFTDEELLDMRSSAMRRLTPDGRRLWFEWMMPALNDSEVVGMLSGMKATMPPPAFEGFCHMVEPFLGQRWQSITQELGL